jgi:hypothetical protein
MSLFDEIQLEILSPASLSAVLRKAKVLAYRLKNQEFKNWIEHELNGYKDQGSLLSQNLTAYYFSRRWPQITPP